MPPATPLCFTPCRGGTECSDGLLPGCISGLECVEGTCVAPTDKQVGGDAGGALPGACEQDYQCPSYQECVAGRCYSTCERDTECRGTRICSRKVCRLPCSAASPTCPSGETCSLANGATGVCVAVAPSSGVVGVPTGSFRLVAGAGSAPTVVLTNTQRSSTFVIHNDSSVEATFTVTKARHSAFSATGSETKEGAEALTWVSLRPPGGTASTAQSLSVTVAAAGSASVTVQEGNGPWSRWNGLLSVSNSNFGSKDVDVKFKSGKEGAWFGDMFFMAANFGEVGLPEWLAAKNDPAKTAVLGNAFIQRWTAFRDNELIEQDFHAMLQSVTDGSWQWANTRAKCTGVNRGCYLANNPSGVSVLSEDLTLFPIPKGVTSLPIQVNLHADPTDGPEKWSGKIVSRETMHYPGDPAIAITFASDPALCDGEDEYCKTRVTDLAATVRMGGRYTVSATGACAAGFNKVTVPWMLVDSAGKGFAAGAVRDATSGKYVRYECRNRTLPTGAADAEYNASLAAANPIPDGATRTRNLTFIDGAMVRQDLLFVIFKEDFPAFIDPYGTTPTSRSGYGFMVLRPADDHIKGGDDYAGNTATDTSTPPTPPAARSCAPALMSALQTAGAVPSVTGALTLSAATAPEIAIALVNGASPNLGSPLPAANIHYYCEDDQHIDGRTTDGTLAPCPEAARHYFAAPVNATLATCLASTAAAGVVTPNTCPWATCNALGGSCQDYWVQGLVAASLVTPLQGTCSPAPCVPSFYAPPAAGVQAFPPLGTAIDEAFAYATKFTTWRGSADVALGFAPEPCPGTASIGYCYDPAVVQQIADRLECANIIYTDYATAVAGLADATLKGALTTAYGRTPDGRPGFERHLSLLEASLGDDQYAKTFTARFDLSGTQANEVFAGSLFEPGGSDFSGPAGFEMASLYRATQYYQLVLDRFFNQVKDIQASLRSGSRSFITPVTATAYVDRVLVASSQKSRAWMEIAKRYQSFNKPAIAARVLGRAYSSAYVESVITAATLRQLATFLGPTDPSRAQIDDQIDQAQRTYRMALVDMRTAARQITDDITVFGFAPDFVPFPVVDGTGNAFETAFARAKAKLDDAKTKENTAIANARSLATDEVSFLGQVQTTNTTFETQLQEICGTFTGDDGLVYAAIATYADKSAKSRALGDPCGLMGTGAIDLALADVQAIALDAVAVVQKAANIREDIANEAIRVTAQCGELTSLTAIQVENAEEKRDLQAGIDTMQTIIDAMKYSLDWADKLGKTAECEPPVAGTSFSPGNCVQLAAKTVSLIAPVAIVGVATGALQLGQLGSRVDIANADIDTIKAQGPAACRAYEIDSAYTVAQFNNAIEENATEARKIGVQLKQIMNTVNKLRNDAQSIFQSWEQAKAVELNIAAAWNDPNIRVFKNDSIINAERSFEGAIQEAYKATKVYEYYTSQSYAAIEKLFLTRMIQYGNPNLDQYLIDLDDAFQSFQQTYGAPENRVMVLSLLDDILGLSELGPDNAALTAQERRQEMRTLLAGTTYRDGDGRIVFPFGTVLDKVSPLTFNHKIDKIQAEITPKIGDDQARVYLVQRGTGVVRNTAGTLNYSALPRRQAVIDTFFGGDKPLGDAVYDNETLRDRPLINAAWDLVIDPGAEAVNRDLNLGELDDIRLYIYYTDFTTQ